MQGWAPTASSRSHRRSSDGQFELLSISDQAPRTTRSTELRIAYGAVHKEAPLCSVSATTAPVPGMRGVEPDFQERQSPNPACVPSQLACLYVVCAELRMAVDSKDVEWSKRILGRVNPLSAESSLHDTMADGGGVDDLRQPENAHVRSNLAIII
jgi:hypothetical protein